MRTKTFILTGLMIFAFSASSFAYDVWHTPSGKSYPIHAFLKVREKGVQATHYLLSYQTTQNLKNKEALLMEFRDLLTNIYYFELSKQIRDNKNAFITIEVFRKLPKSKTKKTPLIRFTQKLSDLKSIVKAHTQTDWNRFQAFDNFNKKNYRKTIAYFKHVKKRVPHDYAQIANAYLFINNKEEALKELQAGIKKYPKDITLINNLAMVTMSQGTYDLEGKYEYDPQKMKEAKHILNQALKLDKNNWQTTANMALLETTVQNFKRAEKLYLKALKLNPHSEQFFYQVADFYHRQKKFKTAKKHYRSALNKLKKSRSPAGQMRATDLTQKIKKRLKLLQQKKTP